MFAPSIKNNKKMKKTILTTVTALVLLSSCKKEDDFQPVIEPTPPVVVEPVDNCLDTCGYILDAHHLFNNTDTITSTLTVATSCDVVTLVVKHTLEDVQFTANMEVCFDRSEIQKQ